MEEVVDSEHEYQEVPTLAATAPVKNHLEKKQGEEEIHQVRHKEYPPRKKG